MTELMFKCSSCDTQLHIDELEYGAGLCSQCELELAKKRIRILLAKLDRRCIYIEVDSKEN